MENFRSLDNFDLWLNDRINLFFCAITSVDRARRLLARTVLAEPFAY